MSYHYDANDIGPSWELMKQDVPQHRTRNLQEQIDDLEEKHIAKVRAHYCGIDDLRGKLTSWPAMLSKRYEVVRALALGWWYQLTPKEQGSIIDFTAVILIGSMVVLFFVWMAVR